VIGAQRKQRVALGAVCLVVGLAAFWNVLSYPPGQGYDASDHIGYADGLVPGGHLPNGVGEYYTPPGYYALAGSADWLARKAGFSAYTSHRAGMGLNALFLLGAVLLTWRLASELWPERPRLALGAAGFVGLLPVSVRTSAMFHPDPFLLFLAPLALWLAARTFRDRRYAAALGVVLGVAQLVRASGLWTVVAVVIALAVGRRFRELVIVLAVALLVPLPWYVHQEVQYGGNPIFPRPPTTIEQGHTTSGSSTFILARRPVGFYVDPGLPDAVTDPVRPHFLNRILPTTYAEVWGDYFGFWAWKSTPAAGGGSSAPSRHARRELELQSVIGILPTLLAIGGWLWLLVGSLRSPPRLAVALLPLAGLLGYLAFAVAHPTADGDVLKATYMLSTTAGWAIGFGYALDRLRGRVLTAVVVALALSAVLELSYLFY
jgi:hypothetical protein